MRQPPASLQFDFARQVFPCIDNPLFKATFDVTLTHPAQYTPVSSERVRSTQVASAGGWSTTVFERTPILPAYAVGMFLYILDVGRLADF